MIAYLIISVFPAALLVAAANDIYEFKIPNWLSIILVCTYPICGLAVGAAPSIVFEGLLVGGAALVVGFALFAGRIVGGGDAKLLAAISPWIGLNAMGLFLFIQHWVVYSWPWLCRYFANYQCCPFMRALPG